MTNTVNNVPRELLERLANTSVTDYEALGKNKRELRALLSTPSPAGVDGLEVAAWVVTGFLSPREIGRTRRAFVVTKADAETQHANWLPHYNRVTTDPLCRLSDAQAIIDGLRGEVAALRKRAKTAEREAGSAIATYKGLEKVARVVSDNSDQVCGELNVLRQQFDQQAQRIVELESKTVRGFLIIDGMAFNPTEILSQNSDLCAALDERDQQAKRIGELEGLLRRANTFFVDDSAPGVELSDEIDAALSADKEGE